jgi:opacity protein-like surface antigen
MRRLLCLSALLLMATLPAMAQNTPRAQVFGGYTYTRFDADGTGVNTHGWNAALAGNFTDHLGIVGDFTGDYSTTAGAHTHLYSYMFGPQAFAHCGRWTPFVHALFGTSHLDVNLPGPNGFDFKDRSFSMKLGGGVDVNLTDHIAVRLLEADYFPTGLFGTNQTNVRLSFGIVLNLGKR